MTLESMQTYMNSIGYSGEVKKCVEYNSESEHGYLVYITHPDYTYPVEFYVPDRKDISGIVNNSGMPPEYMSKMGNDFDFDLYGKDMTPVKKIVNGAIANFMEFEKQGRGLYIYSKTKGSGKTMLSCVIANEILKHNQVTCKFITITDYIDMYRNKDPLLDGIRNASILIIDDFGVQDESKDWINEIVYSLVNRRYNSQCMTIYTSNKDFSEKTISAEDRTASRIYGACIPVQLPGVSIRSKLADKYRQSFMQGVM